MLYPVKFRQQNWTDVFRHSVVLLDHTDLLLLTTIRYTETDLKLHQRKSDWATGISSSHRGWLGTGKLVPCGGGHSNSLREFKEHLDNKITVWFSVRWSCKEQGVALGGPYGSLLTQYSVIPDKVLGWEEQMWHWKKKKKETVYPYSVLYAYKLCREYS